ncbi:hypothetical protein BD779DRAFT_1549383, partial [Infundibulicybe gibba]
CYGILIVKNIINLSSIPLVIQGQCPQCCGKDDASLKQLGLNSRTTDEQLRSEITRRIYQRSKVPGYTGLQRFSETAVNSVRWLLAIAAPPQHATVTAREIVDMDMFCLNDQLNDMQIR